MPTPFTHLEIAQRLLCDAQVLDRARALLEAERSAFLLGNIAADARVDSGLRREVTHFYAYDRPIEERPWRVMLTQHPALQQTHDRAQRAFLAGYVAHLSCDEFWSRHMVRPEFVEREWASRGERFLSLHLLLITMDARDLVLLESWQPDVLAEAIPNGWLTFLTDVSLRGWRDYIARQISPDGGSETLQVLGERIQIPSQELAALVESDDEMQARLWDHIPPERLQRVEAEMYAFAREQMGLYLDDSG